MTSQPHTPPSHASPSEVAWTRRVAVASLVLGAIGLLVGAALIALRGDNCDAYTGATDPETLRILTWVVLPCGATGTVLGLAVVILPRVLQEPPTVPPWIARLGLVIGCVVLAGALGGILNDAMCAMTSD